MKFGKLLLVSTVTVATLSLAGQAAAFLPVWTTDKDAADGTDGSTAMIWHAGATASSISLQSAVREAICDHGVAVSGTGTSVDPFVPDAAHDIHILSTTNYWSEACSAAKSGIAGVTAGQKIIWNKRDEGGSGVGVGPLANNSAIAFMKPSTDAAGNCPAAGAVDATVLWDGSFWKIKTVACPGFSYKLAGPPTPAVCSEGSTTDDCVFRAPDIGTSDIEPDKFAFNLTENNPKTDFDLNTTLETLQTFDPPATADVSTYFTSTNSTAVAYLTFGIPVNVLMYQDLQRMQFPVGHPLFADCNPAGGTYGVITSSAASANSEKCMPSLTGAEIRSILSSTAAIKNSTDLQYLTTYNTATTPFATLAATVNGASNNAIEICRRVKGSGTQAQANAIFMGYPCDRDSSDLSLDTLIMSAESGLNTTIDNEGSGDVEKCLDDYNDGTNGTGKNPSTFKRWAIGIQSTEKNAPSGAGTYGHRYRFIKVDGFAPTIQNVHAGDYYDFASQSLQYRTAAPAPAAGVYDALKVKIQDPAVLSSILNPPLVHAFGQGGWLALPTSTVKPDPSLDLGRPVNWYRRVSSSGKFNTCALPSMFNAKGGAVVNNSATVGPQNCSKFSVGGSDNDCYTNVNPINAVPVE